MAPSSQAPASKGRPYHHGNLRAALMAEALGALSETGPAGLSLRELARRIGVSHAAPYRHFADRDALLAAISEEGFNALAEQLEPAAMSAKEPRARLTAIGWAYVSFALDHSEHFRVMFGDHLTNRTGYPGLAAAATRSFDVLLGAIEGGQRDGSFIAGSPLELAHVAWAEVHGLAVLLLDRQLPFNTRSEQKRIALLCSRVLLDGLAHTSRP